MARSRQKRGARLGRSRTVAADYAATIVTRMRRRQLMVAPVAASCLRLGRDRPKGGVAQLPEPYHGDHPG